MGGGEGVDRGDQPEEFSGVSSVIRFSLRSPVGVLFPCSLRRDLVLPQKETVGIKDS